MSRGGPGNAPAQPGNPDSKRRPLRVLIAHQSTIPHYRVRFYEILESLRPPEWTFEVVYDLRELSRPRVYAESVTHLNFRFPVLDVRTKLMRVAGKRLVWQPFIRHVRNYDLLITDSHLGNLSYPAAAAAAKALGRKWVIWGHASDRNIASPSLGKKLVEHCKQLYVKKCDAFFAYTKGERERAIAAGIPPSRVQVIGNTLDLAAERRLFLDHTPHRQQLRQELGLQNRIVLISVGRLLADKRIDFLAGLFRHLYQLAPEFHLVIIGGGPHSRAVQQLASELGSSAVSWPGSVTHPEELARWYAIADAALMPGSVGLAPLQAICHDLPVLYFDLPTHGPEVEYLVPLNSLLLPGQLDAPSAAEQVRCLEPEFRQLRQQGPIFSTIQHLTLESMARNFIEGINRALSCSMRD